MKAQGYSISTAPEINFLKKEALALLEQLISISSFSREEEGTVAVLENYLKKQNIEVYRKLNNVWCLNKHFGSAKPTILLNSHHDTVKPDPTYTKDPFKPEIADGKLYGLGSNDAGGSLVALLMTFLYFYSNENLNYNFVYAATAEEEISGINGIASVISELPPIDFAIVGEPTLMQMAIAEKGLMVLDCKVPGKAGHAARDEGENAIYRAMEIIEWFRTYKFPEVSPTLGEIKMSVTLIKAGEQHNVVPGLCEFTVDVRTTDSYTNEEALQIIKQHVNCEIKPRSLRLQSSSFSPAHPLVLSGMKLGLNTYGSPTTSDQALMPWPSVKMGPGDSVRSHSANEFIFVNEIENAIETYINLLKTLN